jgi:hypothetical protein
LCDALLGAAVIASCVGAAHPSESSVPSALPPRSIEFEETAQLQILQDGQPVTAIAVTPGEQIRFEVTNTAGFDHNFFIGPPSQLAAGHVAGLVGLPTSSDAETRALDWTVPPDVSTLQFACTLRGHYPSMNGSFLPK